MPDAPIDIDNQVTVTQLRAQWSNADHGVGESSWSFIQPAANPNYLESVADVWFLYLHDLFRAQRPGGWTLDTIRIEDRWPSIRSPIIVSSGWSPIPFDDVFGLPNQCTPVISWRTGLEGRSYRGRTYWGPMRLDHCENNFVVGDGQTAVFDFANEMMLRCTGASFPSNPHFSIVSRVHDGAPSGVIGTYLPVIQYVFLSQFGIMRRRFDFPWRSGL